MKNPFKTLKWSLGIITLLFIMTITWLSCSEVKKDKSIFPSTHWKKSSPKDQGINSAKLNEALQTLESFCGKDGLKETLIIRNGYVVWEGDSTHKVHNIYSCSKSFTSTVLGILVEEGKCKLDDFAHQWEPLLNTNPYKNITLRHFTTMTSGYNAQGDSRWNEPSKDWSFTPYIPGDAIFQPGTHYTYWDEAQMMFGRVLTIIADQPIRDVFHKKVGHSIGLPKFEWVNEGDYQDTPINNGCTNVKINAQQLARFGWLFCNQGNWDGQQLIDNDWVKMATSPQVKSSTPIANTDRKKTKGSGSYGFNWWTNGGESNMPDSPKNLFYASGFNNNMCFVVPEWNMVIVRMGEDGNPKEPKHIAYNRFFKALNLAVIKN